MKPRIVALAVFGTSFLAAAFLAYRPLDAQEKKTMGGSEQAVKRGEYLVMVGGCEDCHSPKTFTAEGPVPDSTKRLSGHQAGEKLPQVPEGIIGPDKWGALMNNHLTAFAGPWGISYARNLTPDVATGLGSWTEEMFIKAMRTGKDMGEGRPILPPMPWQNFGRMTDEDLRAIFAYLGSLKPIDNAVPDPISPTGERLQTGRKESK